MQAAVGLFTGLVALSLCHDDKFEGGRWSAVFPPGPGRLIVMVARRATYWAHPSWWRFAPCDRSGTMQRLYAVPLEEPAKVASVASV